MKKSSEVSSKLLNTNFIGRIIKKNDLLYSVENIAGKQILNQKTLSNVFDYTIRMELKSTLNSINLKDIQRKLN